MDNINEIIDILDKKQNGWLKVSTLSDGGLESELGIYVREDGSLGVHERKSGDFSPVFGDNLAGDAMDWLKENKPEALIEDIDRMIDERPEDFEFACNMACREQILMTLEYDIENWLFNHSDWY